MSKREPDTERDWQLTNQREKRRREIFQSGDDIVKALPPELKLNVMDFIENPTKAKVMSKAKFNQLNNNFKNETGETIPDEFFEQYVEWVDKNINERKKYGDTTYNVGPKTYPLNTLATINEQLYGAMNAIKNNGNAIKDVVNEMKVDRTNVNHSPSFYRNNDFRRNEFIDRWHSWQSLREYQNAQRRKGRRAYYPWKTF